MNCHICGGESEGNCEQCEQPICADCCVSMTLQNQIDYPLCPICYEHDEVMLWNECCEAEQIKVRADAKRTARNDASRARYRQPENVEKRRIAREQRKRAKAIAWANALAEAFGIVNDMMGKK